MVSLNTAIRTEVCRFAAAEPDPETASIRFRLAKPADLSELARLRWKHAGSAKRGTSQVDSDFCEAFKEFMLARLANEEWLVLVAEARGRLVACIYLQKIARLPRPDRLKRQFGCITALFVQKEYRGKGLRGELLREISEVAQAEGLEYITVRPSAENRFLFRRNGFRHIDPEMKLCLK
ncbi:MAG: GNAT family N-acetyltransferase [Verrucomicrobia bacterium]|nr:GNAT family N-acetyltransferase [Verrucomicrobiota bacterium]